MMAAMQSTLLAKAAQNPTVWALYNIYRCRRGAAGFLKECRIMHAN